MKEKSPASPASSATNSIQPDSSAPPEDPAGELTERGFPSWLTIPDGQWLAMARRWHFFFAWLLVVNGITFVTYSVVSRHLHRDLVPTRQDWRSIGRSIIDHLRFRHPTGEAAKHYNVLQKCAYLGVIFFLLPLMILMGLGMSPALDAVIPRLGGYLFRPAIRPDDPFHCRLDAGAVRDHPCV